MAPLLLFLIESSICLAFLYLIYLIFLREDTFHKTKRFYLLASLALSLIIPVLPSPGAICEVQQIIVPAKVRNVNNQHFSDPFEKIVITALPKETPEYNQPTKISFTEIFFTCYFLVSGFMLYRLSMNFRKVYKLIKNNNHENYNRYKIIFLQDEYSSFSFLNYIFLNKSLNDPESQKILQHELVHAKQKHSYDLIFFELYKIFFWINPLVWYYKTSLSQVHECLADESIVTNTDIDDYQLLLLTTYLSNYRIELAHSFNYSLIKFRIKMMTKTKSKWWAKCKIALALPIILMALLAFTDTDSVLNNASNEIIKITGLYKTPEGWILRGSNTYDYQAGVDITNAQHGIRSAFMVCNSEKATGFGTLMQSCNILKFKGQRIRMTGYIKNEGSDSAMMWVRIDDFERKATADFDNMYNRPITGTTDWTKCEIVFDVPNSNCGLYFGFILSGQGKAWFDNVTFEIVDKSIAKTASDMNSPLPLEYTKKMDAVPEKLLVNLDFEE